MSRLGESRTTSTDALPRSLAYCWPFQAVGAAALASTRLSMTTGLEAGN